MNRLTVAIALAFALLVNTTAPERVAAEAGSSRADAQRTDEPTPSQVKPDPSQLDVRGREYEVQRQLRLKPGDAPQLHGPPQ